MITSIPPSTSAPVVLVVDDSPGNRFLLESQLKLEGFQILQAEDGYRCLEIAKEYDPDIVLLDVMMPGIDGFETCRRLKNDPDTHLIPVIMVTALRDVQKRIEGIESGADEFLSRPHHREELLVRLRTLIQLKHARIRLQKERNNMELLYKISRAVNAQLDIESMMAEIISQTRAAVGATKGNIMLMDENGRVTDKFLIRAGGALEVSETVASDVMDKGLGGWLRENKQGDIIDDINKDPRWIRLPDDVDETGSAIGVPLYSHTRVVGVLILNHPQSNFFQKEQLALLETMGTTVAAAIENASLFKEINESQRKLGAVLAQSTDAIIITTEEWHISLFNRAAERLFLIESEDVIGRQIADVARLKALMPALNGRSSPEEINLPNDKIYYVTVSAIQNVGYAILMQDITELKRMEKMRLQEERREKTLVKETFSRYMGPQLVDHVLSHEPGLMARRERRHAVVMFADLRNWTGGMISKIEPNEAINQLNEFFTRMMAIALENNGTVFELTGDEILVGFNAPLDQPDAVYLALKTAVAMQNAFHDLRQRWYERIGTKLGLGIGIDQGEIVMGNVGAESRLSFRMVGSAMNTAHRLVDLAEDGQIVVSDDVFHALHALQPDWTVGLGFHRMGPIKLKGITKPKQLYYVEMERKALT